ncbi:MAG TPA: hypothetical protein VF737_13685 [Gemmatimonadaceae bacterium]
MSCRMLALGAAALLGVAACTDRSVVSPTAQNPSQPAFNVTSVIDPAPAPWARIVTGRTGPNSKYKLYIPADWNGDAVFYAHGFRTPFDPIDFDDTQDSVVAVRTALGNLGYALAYSTFDENGLVVKDGADRTHQLRGLLASELHGQPHRSYLLGFSLGGGIALNLAETYPKQYDGLLTVCGMVGGTPIETQYIGDVRALFDYFYPGVLPGDVTSVPWPPLSKDEVIARVMTAVGANPLGLFVIASTAQTPLAYEPVGDITDPSSTAFQTLFTSLIYALYNQQLSTPGIEAQTHGHPPYGNRGVTYTLGTPVGPAPAPVLEALIAQANANVGRYDISPDASNYLAKYYTPTGVLPFPTVTVHALWDPFVPYFHETALAERVQAAGYSDMLVQRGVPVFTHCDLDASLVMSSFQDLVNWVTTGNKPAN